LVDLRHDFYVVEASRSECTDGRRTKGATLMHDILIGLTFIGMVISPAIVAAFSDSSEASEQA
jgi:hypothetical protein